ncbi:hypothetical protein GLAREA_12552 [Glarea lozoyensis ATCC 20868]|uniref:Uncharacterized protein n=2 Tax=Glarea lozoyensis TaxID=101852 RepID=S3D276_GLAL2|nr:uncharacterized protein GLAREA_12552 [Glarea lozoyensis ATCC 20868]EPE31249.1 hypothetical protein GLAREA_12552 [Glarea lozoyensis ATCC 20868]
MEPNFQSPIAYQDEKFQNIEVEFPDIEAGPYTARAFEDQSYNQEFLLRITCILLLITIIALSIFIICEMLATYNVQREYDLFTGVRRMSRPDMSSLQDIRGERYARLLMEMRARKAH